MSETRPRPNGESAALISAKDETIRVLQEQLEAEREAHREARRIIAGLVQRIPELEATQEPSGASEGVVEEPERSEPRPLQGTLRKALSRGPGGGGSCSEDRGRLLEEETVLGCTESVGNAYSVCNPTVAILYALLIFGVGMTVGMVMGVQMERRSRRR